MKLEGGRGALVDQPVTLRSLQRDLITLGASGKILGLIPLNQHVALFTSSFPPFIIASIVNTVLLRKLSCTRNQSIVSRSPRLVSESVSGVIERGISQEYGITFGEHLVSSSSFLFG